MKKSILHNFWDMFYDFICMVYPKLCEDCGIFLQKYEEEYCLYCKWKYPWNISDRELEKIIEK